MHRFSRRLIPAAIVAIAVVGCGAPFEPDTGGSTLPPPPPPAGPSLPFRVGSFGADFAKAVATDPTGNAYVISSFTGTVDFDPGSGTRARISRGGNDIALAKYRTDGSLAWATSLGGTGADIPYDVKLASSGSLYLAGYASTGVSCNGLVVPNAGGRDAFIARVSALGSCEWAIAVGGALDDEARNLVVEPNGDVVVTGLFRGTVDFDPGAGTALLTARGGSDGFVARYSSGGAFRQVVQFGGLDDDAGSTITRTLDGDLLVGGEFRGSATFGSALAPAILVSAGENDYFVARLATSLGLLWAIRGGGAGADLVSANGIVADPNGTVLVAGTFSGAADVDPAASVVLLTSQGLTDVFVVRYDGSGVWSGLARRFGGSGSDGVQGFARDASGNLYLAGWFQGSVDFDPGAGVQLRSALGTAGAADGYLLSLDLSGDFRWVSPVGAVIAGDANFSLTSGVAAPGDGSVWAVGRFFGFADLDPGATAVLLQSLGDADQFVARYDAGTGALRR